MSAVEDRPNPEKEHKLGMDDPRVWEFRRARASVNEGLRAPRGAHERYQASIAPYLGFMAEFCPQHSPARRHLMAALFYESALPLGAIAIAFRATQDDIEWIGAREPEFRREPVDEQEKLYQLAVANYRMYLRTPHWRAVRKAALERYEHKCAICNRTEGLEVHHRTYDRVHPRYGAERPADVIVLCAEDHRRYHRRLRPV